MYKFRYMYVFEYVKIGEICFLVFERWKRNNIKKKNEKILFYIKNYIMFSCILYIGIYYKKKKIFL